MTFLLSDPPSGVRLDLFFDLFVKGNDVTFLLSDPPPGVGSGTARSLAGTSSTFGVVVDIVEHSGEGCRPNHRVLCSLFDGGSDGGGASSVDATKRVAVDGGGGRVVLVEVGWAAHVWIGSGV